MEDMRGGFFSATGLSNHQGGAKVRGYASDLTSQLGDSWTGAVEPEIWRGEVWNRLGCHCNIWRLEIRWLMQL